ncbi:hypothetical protein L1887_09011 [Cichorium endivia]|nr:hypothetical protein L1887_09011 [Cichorium endivia]
MFQVVKFLLFQVKCIHLQNSASVLLTLKPLLTSNLSTINVIWLNSRIRRQAFRYVGRSLLPSQSSSDGYYIPNLYEATKFDLLAMELLLVP